MRNPHINPGFWRGVNVNQNAIYLECFMDELANAVGQDPLEFRRRLMSKNPKHLAVLDAVAEKIGWGSPAPEGVYRGLAQLHGYGSYVAGAAEISVIDGTKIKIHRIVASTDPGFDLTGTDGFAGLLNVLENGALTTAGGLTIGGNLRNAGRVNADLTFSGANAILENEDLVDGTVTFTTDGGGILNRGSITGDITFANGNNIYAHGPTASLGGTVFGGTTGTDTAQLADSEGILRVFDLDALDGFAGQLAFQVNRVHSQGQGSSLRSSFTGSVELADTSANLGGSYSGLPFEIENGSFQSDLVATGSLHGAQAARVRVDTFTGRVEVVKMVAIHDQGLILNRLALTSQINGALEKHIRRMRKRPRFSAHADLFHISMRRFRAKKSRMRKRPRFPRTLLFSTSSRSCAVFAR